MNAGMSDALTGFEINLVGEALEACWNGVCINDVWHEPGLAAVLCLVTARLAALPPNQLCTVNTKKVSTHIARAVTLHLAEDMEKDVDYNHVIDILYPSLVI